MGGRGGGGKGGAGGGGGGGEVPSNEPKARADFDKASKDYNNAVGKQRAYAKKHGPAGKNSPQYKSLQRRAMQQKSIRAAARKRWIKIYRKSRTGTRSLTTGKTSINP